MNFSLGLVVLTKCWKQPEPKPHKWKRANQKTATVSQSSLPTAHALCLGCLDKRERGPCWLPVGAFGVHLAHAFTCGPILHTGKWYFLCSLMLGHLVLGNLEATCWYLCRMEVIPHLQQGQGELGQRR